MEDTSAQPVDRPAHYDVEPSPHRVLERRIECGTLIPALGAADTLVFLGLLNRPAAMSGSLR
jgi:hypothetical protein